MKKFGLLVSFLAFVFLFNLMFSACKPASKKSEELPAEPSSKLSEEFIDMDMVVKYGCCYAAISYFMNSIEPNMCTVLLICLFLFVVSSLDHMNRYLSEIDKNL